MKPYLAAVVWFLFLTYLIVPIPYFNSKGRIYMFKLIFSAMVAPLHHVEFSIVWITDQFVSLITPLKDFAYTICYYTKLDLSNINYPNVCASSTNF
jgi:hypothetical protein